MKRQIPKKTVISILFKRINNTTYGLCHHPHRHQEVERQEGEENVVVVVMAYIYIYMYICSLICKAWV